MNQVPVRLTPHRLGQRFVAGAEKRQSDEELAQTSPITTAFASRPFPSP